MKILPVAFESMGVRSMATYVETSDLRIFIDPGVSVSPDRYSMPPHTVE
jgi:predicted metallo-beta-lactamase superfamily hydrolase